MATTQQQTLPFEPLDMQGVTVDLCCRECDAETTMTRIDASSIGWSVFVYEKNLSWTWYDFSAICPRCRGMI
jgi:hypothetical protein